MSRALSKLTENFLGRIAPRRNRLCPRPECVAKLFAALRASNNRIEANGPLNQYCALACRHSLILAMKGLYRLYSKAKALMKPI
jgi:hypothetical protein